MYFFVIGEPACGYNITPGILPDHSVSYAELIHNLGTEMSVLMYLFSLRVLGF